MVESWEKLFTNIIWNDPHFPICSNDMYNVLFNLKKIVVNFAKEIDLIPNVTILRRKTA